MASHEYREVDEPTSLYLYYDRNDVLLYIGITSRGMKRQSEHSDSKAWWPYVVRQDIKHYPSRAAALDEERRMIMQHRPPFNSQHNPDYAVKSAAYLAYSPPPSTEIPDHLTCDVCGMGIEGRFKFSVDSADLSQAIRSSADFTRAYEAEARMQLLEDSSVRDVIGLIIESSSEFEAKSTVREQIGVDENAIAKLMDERIGTLVRRNRALAVSEGIEAEKVPTPSVARWRIHHAACSDSEYSFDVAGLLSAADAVTITHNLHRFCGGWVLNTDWAQFFPRLLKRAE